MPTTAPRLWSCLTPVAVGLLLSLAPLPLAAQSASDEARTALHEMEVAAGAPVAASWSPATGLVTFLSVEEERAVPVTGASFATPEEVALSFLRSYGRAFGLRDADAQVELRSPAERDELGMDHVRFRQVVAGVPVTAGELTVHLKGFSVVAVNAETLPGLEGFDVRPKFFAEQAYRLAFDLVAVRLGRPDAELSAPRLEILNRGLLEEGRFPTRLAWFIEATGFGLREYIWIDAERGVPLLRFNQLMDARNRSIHDANDGSVLPGTLVRSEGGPATGDADADAAYTYSGDTYDYFFNQHGRDSYDGAGAALISTVHYCPSPADCPFPNAFWNGTQMVYGEGFSAADDVDAHELTHAVTEYSASLFYYMQSGALNESFSDMFGETVDLSNTGGTDTPAVRWLMGEDVPGIGAIRDMMDPGTFGDPARVGDPNYFCGYADGGGVHINSGVPNHFYALLVDGGAYNGQTVTGIGLTKAGKIAYRALTVYLTSGSSFGNAVTALKQSCADLVGTAGITVADCQEVSDALAAVEMAQAPPCAGGAAGQYPPLCPAGQGPANLFFDDFEAGGSNTNWLSQWTAANTWFYSSFAFNTSGIWHLSGFNVDFINDARALMANSVALPGSARMQFNHFWDFEPPIWDGGVVEYSLNGGTTWSDAMSLFSAGASYTGTVASGYGNPLAARSAFVGTSRGYTGTQLNLSSLAGQNVKFRFRMGTDSLFGWWGWDVDDVRIYQCVGCTYSLGAASGFAGAGGSSGTVDVITQPGCAWTVASSAAWLTSTPGATGSVKLGWTAAPNSTGSPRSATLTIGGQVFTVYQGAATDFYTLVPCRVFDTRTSSSLSSGSIRTFNVAGACGIPATAKAISANVTSLTPTGQGHVTFFPGGLPRPLTSTLNFAFDTIRANNAILSLAPNGSGQLQGYAFVAGGGTVHVILDVNGYFE